MQFDFPGKLNKMTLSAFSVSIALIFYTAGLTGITYPFLALMCLLWVRNISVKDFLYLVTLFLIWLAIVLFNVTALENYLDLTLKGALKLGLFALSSIAYKKYFTRALSNITHLRNLRIVVWFVLVISLIMKSGIDLQSMQQVMVINLVFLIEFIAYIRGESKLFFYLIAFVLLITTKKQLWFSALALVLFIHPAVIRLFIILLAGALIFISVFGLVGVQHEGITAEKRADSFLSERFITPDPYGNMRLYLAVTLVPRVVDHGMWFGFGLERFGSIEAYETDRDIERSKLGLANFVDSKYNSDTLFGSVAADVGILTILMQMGLCGVIYYFLMLSMLGQNTATFLKGLCVLLPYFLGGPIVYSVGFPILAAIVYSEIALPKLVNKATRPRNCTNTYTAIAN